ncbi:hypothetical protein Hanom_Chr17g01555721 [Helianthus anomalus]
MEQFIHYIYHNCANETSEDHNCGEANRERERSGYMQWDFDDHTSNTDMI